MRSQVELKADSSCTNKSSNLSEPPEVELVDMAVVE